MWLVGWLVGCPSSSKARSYKINSNMSAPAINFFNKSNGSRRTQLPYLRQTAAESAVMYHIRDYQPRIFLKSYASGSDT